MNQPSVETHHLRILYGIHKGELWTRLPIPYLQTLVAARYADAHIAQAELDRRGITNPRLYVTAHAIDRASVHALDVYVERRQVGEGIASWLSRIAREAIESEPDLKRQVRQAKEVPAERDRLPWGPLELRFDFATVWPILKTVVRPHR